MYTNIRRAIPVIWDTEKVYLLTEKTKEVAHGGYQVTGTPLMIKARMKGTVLRTDDWQERHIAYVECIHSVT